VARRLGLAFVTALSGACRGRARVARGRFADGVDRGRVLIYRAWLAAAGQAASGIRALPAADSTMRSTRSLQPPQPVPARVAVAISCSVRLPEVTHESMSALLTPLQLQTWVSGASSSSRSSARG
jgi:hypothetical protein